MDENCILCGKVVKHDAKYTGRVGGALLHPVCLDCWTLCEKEPDRVISEHRNMIDDILADYEQHWKAHRFDHKMEVGGEKPSAPSSAETILAKKYKDAYGAANEALRYASSFKIIGFVFATLMIVGGTFVVIGMPELARSPLTVFGGLISAALVAISFYWCGTLLTGLGQLLLVTTDIAVNISPFLSIELKAKEVEVPFIPERQAVRAA